MRSAIIGFVVGAGWLQAQAALPSWFVIFLSCVLGAVLIGMARIARRTKARIPLLAVAGLSLGFAWAALFAHHHLSQELPPEWEGRDITVVGTVDSLPDRFARGLRFRLAVEKVLPAGGEMPVVPSRIALSWYSAFDDEEAGNDIAVRPGERWRLTVRLRRPHGNANPHGFDYEQWLLEQNVRATGYVRAGPQGENANARLDAFVPGFRSVVERGRGWLRERVQRALEGKPYAGVIVALVVGDQRAVDQESWNVFNRTGIGHLISISGLHITMIAAMFAGIVFALWRRSFFTGMQLPLRLPAQKAAALAGVSAAVVYVLLAGAGIPAQRTLCMLTVVALALWFGRIASVSHVLCLALLAVVLLDPWAVLGAGFWLSFGAVAVILYASVGRASAGSKAESASRPGWRAALDTAVLTQYAVTVGLIPLTMLLFGQVSLVSPIANAIAIPLVSFFVTPLALVGSVLPEPLSDWCLLSAHFPVEWLAYGLTWLSDLPFAVWTAPLPAWWMFALAMLGTLWMLAPRGWPARYLGVLTWLPLLLNVPTHPPAGAMWVTAFDVGQGMALLVETQNHRLLYDAGPAYSPESDGGSRVIVPYLRARGIASLDGMIVSHSDTDHAGGALSVLENIRAGWLSSSLPLQHPIVAAARAHRRCEAGEEWQWDGVRFEMLHPAAGMYDSPLGKPNARSCTLRITAGGRAILLAGDIEAGQEAELLAREAGRLRADVLLAPHHGSGTSSTPAFLRAVDPQVALFQVGYRNRYRHPKQEVFDRYGEMGIERLRSDRSGAVTLRFGPSLEVAEYRKERPRYWHGR